MLALDELDEFRQSDWAMERFHRLIDERWRSMEERLTLLATNANMRMLAQGGEPSAGWTGAGGDDCRRRHAPDE